jgi:hypothetical protein
MSAPWVSEARLDGTQGPSRRLTGAPRCVVIVAGRAGAPGRNLPEEHGHHVPVPRGQQSQQWLVYPPWVMAADGDRVPLSRDHGR